MVGYGCQTRGSQPPKSARRGAKFENKTPLEPTGRPRRRLRRPDGSRRSDAGAAACAQRALYRARAQQKQCGTKSAGAPRRPGERGDAPRAPASTVAVVRFLRVVAAARKPPMTRLMRVSSRARKASAPMSITTPAHPMIGTAHFGSGTSAQVSTMLFEARIRISANPRRISIESRRRRAMSAMIVRSFGVGICRARGTGEGESAARRARRARSAHLRRAQLAVARVAGLAAVYAASTQRARGRATRRLQQARRAEGGPHAVVSGTPAFASFVGSPPVPSSRSASSDEVGLNGDMQIGHSVISFATVGLLLLLARGEPRASRAVIGGAQSLVGSRAESADGFVSSGSCAVTIVGGHELPRLDRRDQRRGRDDVGLQSAAASNERAGTRGSVNHPPRAAAGGASPSAVSRDAGWWHNRLTRASVKIVAMTPHGHTGLAWRRRVIRHRFCWGDRRSAHGSAVTKNRGPAGPGAASHGRPAGSVPPSSSRGGRRA